MDQPELLRYSYSRGWQEGKVATALDGDSGNWTKLMLYDGEMGQSDDHQQRQHYSGVSYPPRELHPRLCVKPRC